MSRLPVTWHLREPPLEPVAVLGTGAVARLLAGAVMSEAVSALRFAASADSLLIVGDTGDLPWVDGARYLGRDDGLLVPTTRESSVPADLLRAALAEAIPGQEFAVLEGRVFAFPALTAGADPRWLRKYARGVAS
jgi:hypothetical protein